MFEMMLFLTMFIILIFFIAESKQASKKIEKQLKDAERVTDRTRVMCVSGEHLNKQKEIQIEVQGAHLASLEQEERTWRSKRKDYEAAIHKQTKSRKKKIRGKKRRGR
jgi:biopolymer transport protein ExbD